MAGKPVALPSGFVKVKMAETGILLALHCPQSLAKLPFISHTLLLLHIVIYIWHDLFMPMLIIFIRNSGLKLKIHLFGICIVSNIILHLCIF